jgi:AraC-like DNA-binding protein
MRSGVQTVAFRPNENLQYWRHHDLADATLVRAEYGPFSWEKHVHDEQVIVLSEYGSGEVVSRRGKEVGGPGSIWVFMPGDFHFGRVGEGKRWHYRALYLDETTLESIAQQLGYGDGKRLILKPGLHDDAQLSQMLLRAHATIGVEQAEEETRWSLALRMLFARYGDPQREVVPGAASMAALDLAREYVAEHFRDDVSIDELARLTNLSRAHFIRAFHAAFGMPPHAYLNQVRLQNARKLLLAGGSVSEAAAESGFYDQSRLNRFFKRAYGVTPSRYARLLRL